MPALVAARKPAVPSNFRRTAPRLGHLTIVPTIPLPDRARGYSLGCRDAIVRAYGFVLDVPTSAIEVWRGAVPRIGPADLFLGLADLVDDRPEVTLAGAVAILGEAARFLGLVADPSALVAAADSWRDVPIDASSVPSADGLALIDGAIGWTDEDMDIRRTHLFWAAHELVAHRSDLSIEAVVGVVAEVGLLLGLE